MYIKEHAVFGNDVTLGGKLDICLNCSFAGIVIGA